MMNNEQALQFKDCIDTLFNLAFGGSNEESLLIDDYRGNEFKTEMLRRRKVAQDCLRRLGLLRHAK